MESLLNEKLPKTAWESFTSALVSSPKHSFFNIFFVISFLVISFLLSGKVRAQNAAPGALDNPCANPAPIEVCNGASCQTLLVCGVQNGPAAAALPLAVSPDGAISNVQSDLTFAPSSSSPGSPLSLWVDATDKCAADSTAMNALNTASGNLFGASASVTAAMILARQAVNGAEGAVSGGMGAFRAAQDKFFSGEAASDPVGAQAQIAQGAYNQAAVILADCPVQSQAALGFVNAAYQTLNGALSSSSLSSDCQNAVSLLIGGGGSSVIPSGTSPFSDMETHLLQLKDSCEKEITAYAQLAKNLSAGDALVEFSSTAGQPALAVPLTESVSSVSLGLVGARADSAPTRGLASLAGASGGRGLASREASFGWSRSEALRPAFAVSALDMEAEESASLLSLSERLTRAVCGQQASRCELFEKAEKSRRQLSEMSKKTRGRMSKTAQKEPAREKSGSR